MKRIWIAAIAFGAVVGGGVALAQMGPGQPGSGMGPGMMGGDPPQEQGQQSGGPMGPGMMGPGGMMGGGMMGQGMMGPGMMGGGHPGGMGPGMMMGGSRFERPLISEILAVKDQLKLSPEQEQKLRNLRTGFEKEAIRRGAEIRTAEVDLRELLAAETPDLGKVEAQVKRIAALQGDLRFARIKVLQEGRAVLTKEQWQKFEALPPRWGRGGQPGHGMGPGGMMMGSGMMGGMMQGQTGAQGMPGMMTGGMGQGGQQAPAGGAGGATRTDSTGPVTVVATLLPTRGDRVAFEVKLDTHSVELDSYKAEAGVTLRNDRGDSAPAVVQSSSGSGHHRGATLAFPASLAAGGAKYVELVVRDLGGVKERVLRWDGPFAGR